MIEKLINLHFYYRPFFAIFLSFLLLCAHGYRFKFLLNKSTVYLTLMLPVCILIITQTISTNLYLSLGLIGALSIVRYRTPVKNQYELAYLFALIGIGIVCGVNPFFALLLVIILIAIPFFYEFLCLVFPQFSGIDLRFNSTGRSELSMLLSLSDLNKIQSNPKNGKLLRIEKNIQNKEAYILMSFDTLSDAVSYENSLKIKIKSSSITNV